MLKVFFARKVSFINGFIFALLISSVIAFALTKPYIFNADTPISSAQVNENFDLLYDEVGGMLKGFIARPEFAYEMTCTSPMTFDNVNTGVFHRNDGNFTATSATYAVAESGVYRIYNMLQETSSLMFSSKLILNGIEDIWFTNTIMYLEMGDELQFVVSCDSTKASMVEISHRSIIAVVPL
jgi:hypothetical protein